MSRSASDPCIRSRTPACAIRRYLIKWPALAILLLGLVAAPGGAWSQGHEIVVDPELMEQLQSDPSTGYLVYFRDRADLSAAYEMPWIERGRFVVQALQGAARAAQGRVETYLKSSGAEFQGFWIDNVIVVESSDRSTFDGLLQFQEIASLRAMPENIVFEPESPSHEPEVWPLAPGTNIVQVNAPDVWAMGIEGQGFVVGNIDTGVRYTHEALVNQYRGNLGGGSFNHNYNWRDPGLNSPNPVDGNGHGTHVMGTQVGRDASGVNEIGVAPGAQWIACRGCPGASCPAADLLACAQFMAAPTDLGGGNPDPDLRPHAVNNSWGNCQQVYNDWYQASVNAWHAAGIVPVFANGNNSNCGYPVNPPCNTVGNPGRYGNVLGVGSTGNNNGLYATHSNKGPTDNPWPFTGAPFDAFANIKPNVAAPGVNIRSAGSGSDSSYVSSGWTGTSMSAPHVTGLVALLWQAAPCLIGNYQLTAEIIMGFSAEIAHVTTCGGEGPGNVPNHATGWGEMDALAIALAGQAVCGDPGTIIGTVTRSDDSTPIDGALVEAVGPVTLSATTEPDGTYEIQAFPGTYDVTASKQGFVPQTVSGVVVEENETEVVDFALDGAPAADISPSSFAFSVFEDGTDADTLNVGNIGNAPLTWSIATDVPGGIVVPLGHDPSLNEPIAVPDFQVISAPNGGSPVVFTLPGGVLTSGEVLGFHFIGTASGITGNSSWASDTCMIVEAPSGETYAVGGFSGTQASCNVNPWDFQGNASNNDGTYQSTHDNVFPAVGDTGNWTFTFINDWNSAAAATISWTDVTVTLLKSALPLCDDVTAVPWLDVDPASGVTPAGGSVPVAVTVDADGLGLGSYDGGLCITTDDPDQPLVVVPVELTVMAAAPIADISPSSFDFEVLEGESDTQTVNVGNLGTANLVWSIETDMLTALVGGLGDRGGHGGPVASRQPAAEVATVRVRESPRGPMSMVGLESEAVKEPALPMGGGWTQAAALSPGRVRYAHAECPGDLNRFYVFAGVDPTFNATADSRRYDAETNNWSPLAPIPQGLEGPAAVCFQGKIYVAGGGGTTAHQIYDIAANDWDPGAALPRAMWGAAMGAWNGQVFMIGGASSFGFGTQTNAVDIYDIATNTWNAAGQGTPMPHGTVASGFVQLGRYVYVVGGWDSASPGANVNMTMRYDMETDTWSTGPTFTSARSDFALAGNPTALYSIGGDANGGTPFDATNLVERLELADWPGGSWQPSTNLPAPLTAHRGGFATGAVVGGEVWSSGGFTGGAAVDTNQYLAAEGFVCANPTAVPWLDVTPDSGVTPPSGTVPVDVTVDASGLSPGDYEAHLCISTNDPTQPLVVVPIELTVLEDPCPVGPSNLVLENVTLSGTVVYEACWTITAGPDVTITSTSDVTFRAGKTIILRSGVEIETGASFVGEIDPSLQIP